MAARSRGAGRGESLAFFLVPSLSSWRRGRGNVRRVWFPAHHFGGRHHQRANRIVIERAVRTRSCTPSHALQAGWEVSFSFIPASFSWFLSSTPDREQKSPVVRARSYATRTAARQRTACGTFPTSCHERPRSSLRQIWPVSVPSQTTSIW